MHRPGQAIPSSAPATSVPSDSALGSAPADSPSSPLPTWTFWKRNLLCISFYQVLVRTGWIFKTESVVMPAFLDLLAGPAAAAWLRSVLQVLNRFGQSVPPLLASGLLMRLGHKKPYVLCTTGAMALCFGAIGLLGLFPQAWSVTVRVGVFLALYGLFFCATGLNQLGMNTLQGKLIPPHRRGRLLALSSVVGSTLAVLAAWWWMPQWVTRPGGFGVLFFTSGALFAGGLLGLALLREPAQDPPPDSSVGANALRALLAQLGSYPSFATLLAITMLFSSSLFLFPHYQALAREHLGLGGVQLMVWVVVQNVALGSVGVVVGTLADRRGTRLALRVLLFLVALGPLWAVALGYGWVPQPARWFWTVFILLGFTPVTIRMLANYTLELVPAAEHPRFLSVVNFSLAAPFVLSPLVGWMIDLWGYGIVFVGVSVLLLTAAGLTFLLEEPRKQHPGPLVPSPLGQQNEVLP